jgi:GAF domain-containing protein
MEAPLPANENRRLEVLKSYRILDTEAEAVFDDLARLAAYICDTPTALICIIDGDRQWFKARFGFDFSETSRSIALCAHAILGDEVLIVPDARQDVKFKYNPLVTDAPRIVFYAGAPLRSPEGQNLGTICSIDYRPRNLTTAQCAALQALSRQVVALLETRRINDQLEREIHKREEAEGELDKLKALATDSQVS